MKNNKNYLIAALWFICGNLTWKSAPYLFGNFTSHLVFPIYNFTNEVLHIHLRAAFMVYTITDLIIIFLIALLLSMATGKRNIRILTYIVGAVGWPLYYTIRNHIAIYQEKLPVWNTLILSITVLLIITPLVAWAGTILGNRYRMRKTT
jgi:hypothetical protein